jgi:hypothetical protein
MNAGSIHSEGTAAWRIYQLLRSTVGLWWSGWELTQAAQVTAVGTRVSEVRHQLPAGERLEHKAEHEGQRGSWYRLVVDEGAQKNG